MGSSSLRAAFDAVLATSDLDAGARRAQYLRIAKEYREGAMAQLRARHYAGAPGSTIVEDLTASVDDLLSALFDLALQEQEINGEREVTPCALVALGGYGRGALFPCSDLDVMLVHEKRLTSRIEDLNSFLLYFLWDAGFKVGHSVRSVTDAIRFAQVDDVSRTAMLESRLVAGNRDTFEKYERGILRQVQAKGLEKFIASKQRERTRAYRDLGEDVYVTEPHVKQSAGGLRDYQTGLWIAIAKYGHRTPRALWQEALISEEEYLRLDLALDFIYRVRTHLHFEAGMQDDHLTLERQEQIAAAFSYEATDMSEAVQLFMQDYYQNAVRLHEFYQQMLALAKKNTSRLRALMTRLTSEQVDRGLMVANQQVMLPENESAWFREDPARLLEVVWYAQKFGLELSERATARVRANADLIDDEFRRSPMAREYFLAMLHTPARAGATLRLLDSLDLLDRYIPEFRATRGRVRAGGVHQYPVDEHTLRAVENLARISQLEDKSAHALKSLLDAVPRPDLLALGIFMHDLGAVSDDNHVDAGILLAEQVGDRLGLQPDETETLAFLVRQHLTMSKLSQYRDMDDPKVARDFAEEMGSVERLDLLYLLTFCDVTAVREGAWTDWKSMLLLQLYRSTHSLLTGSDGRLAQSDKLAAKRHLVADLLPASEAASVEAHFAAMRPAYFRAFRPVDIAAHLKLAERLERSGVAFQFEDYPALGSSRITIVTSDRPRLFCTAVGALASLRITILEAHIFTRDDGTVIDVFRVADPKGAGPLGQDMWETVRKRLRQVLQEGRDVAELLARTPGDAQLRRAPLAAARFNVTFDNQVSDAYTVIDIEAGDRIGLLFDLASTLADLDLDLALAKIATNVRQARDAFYVQTRDGAKLTQPNDLERVRTALTVAARGELVAERIA